MSKWRRLSVCALAGALALSLSGCGGDNPTAPATPAATPPPPPPPPAVVSQGVGLFLEFGFIGWVTFETSQSGTLEATVDWTFPENDIDVALVHAPCSFEQFVEAQCNLVAISASTTAKPEVVSSSAGAGDYVLFIMNAGPSDETFSYQVVLTPGATASASQRSLPAAAWPRKGEPRGFVQLR